jgi:RimJ/RimL family protein N-acetyltransferase
MVPVPERLAHGGKFELLPVYSDCIADLFEAEIESIEELVPWMHWCHPNRSISDTTQWVESRSEAWERRKAYSFLIADRRSSQIVGTCGLDHLDEVNHFANLGYWVRTSRTRESAATEATRLLSEFGFSAVELVRIEIVVAVGNIASERVAVKVGALREGLLRNRLTQRGEVRDAYMFSLVPNPDKRD